MDTLTHAVIGALVVRVTRRGRSSMRTCNEGVRLGVVAGASIFPDLDYATFIVNPYRFITEWHRGVSHSLLMLPLWAILLGSFVSRLIGRSDLRWELIRLSALGLSLHILFDLVTVYGTQVFAPWSDYRVAFGLTFDVDFWIAMIAGISLLLSFYRRVFAHYGIVLLVFYLGVASSVQWKAIRIGESHFGLSAYRVHAIAHPLSPLHRILIVEADSGYRRAFLSLYRLPSRFLETRILQKSGLGEYRDENRLRWESLENPAKVAVNPRWVRALWACPELKPLRRFAVLPVLYRLDRAYPGVCVWFTDLRYVFPGFLPPFRYGMCREPGYSDWRAFRLKRFTWSEREAIESVPPDESGCRVGIR